MALTTDCNSLPEKNQVARGESTQQPFPYNGIYLKLLYNCAITVFCYYIDYIETYGYYELEPKSFIFTHPVTEKWSG